MSVTEAPTLRRYVVEVVREYPNAETVRDRVQFSDLVVDAVNVKDAHDTAIREVARLHPKAEKIVVHGSQVVR